jgi:hypothetical protein
MRKKLSPNPTGLGFHPKELAMRMEEVDEDTIAMHPRRK